MTEKRFNVFDVDGTIFLEDHKEGSYHIGEIGNVDVNCLNDIADRLNGLAEENKELKKRLSHAEKVNIGLIDENHRLRLTIIHSSDLNFDINWLKENLKDWNNYD